LFRVISTFELQTEPRTRGCVWLNLGLKMKIQEWCYSFRISKKKLRLPLQVYNSSWRTHGFKDVAPNNFPATNRFKNMFKPGEHLLNRSNFNDKKITSAAVKQSKSFPKRKTLTTMLILIEHVTWLNIFDKFLTILQNVCHQNTKIVYID